MYEWNCLSCGEVNEYQDLRDLSSIQCHFCQNKRRSPVDEKGNTIWLENGE